MHRAQPRSSEHRHSKGPRLNPGGGPSFNDETSGEESMAARWRAMPGVRRSDPAASMAMSGIEYGESASSALPPNVDRLSQCGAEAVAVHAHAPGGVAAAPVSAVFVQRGERTVLVWAGTRAHDWPALDSRASSTATGSRRLRRAAARFAAGTCTSSPARRPRFGRCARAARAPVSAPYLGRRREASVRSRLAPEMRAVATHRRRRGREPDRNIMPRSEPISSRLPRRLRTGVRLGSGQAPLKSDGR